MGLNLRLGGKYVTRGGDVVEVTYITPDTYSMYKVQRIDDPIIDYFVDRFGRFFYYINLESNNDVISEYIEPPKLNLREGGLYLDGNGDVVRIIGQFFLYAKPVWAVYNLTRDVRYSLDIDGKIVRSTGGNMDSTLGGDLVSEIVGPTTEEKPKLNLRIGGEYMNGMGTIVRVVGGTGDEQHPFLVEELNLVENTYSVTIDGFYYRSEKPHHLDLIEEVGYTELPVSQMDDFPTAYKVSESAAHGLRYNKGKIDLTQLSPVAQKLESLVFMYGESKYVRDNWKKFKATEEEALLEFLQCAKRHIMKYEEGQWLDDESGQPHLAHAVWNLNRIMDVYYYGMTHGVDGKDLYHQPLRRELPKVPGGK